MKLKSLMRSVMVIRAVMMRRLTSLLIFNKVHIPYISTIQSTKTMAITIHLESAVPHPSYLSP